MVEGPLALVSVGEGGVGVGAARSCDDLATAVLQLAPDLRVQKSADGDFDGLEGTGATRWRGGRAVLEGLEDGLRGEVAGGEGYADLEVLFRRLLEIRVTDDFRDFARSLEGPGTLVGVGEGDVLVGALGTVHSLIDWESNLQCSRHE